MSVRLSPGAVKVLEQIIKRTDCPGLSVTIRFADMAQYTGLSTRTIGTATEELVEAGLVKAFRTYIKQGWRGGYRYMALPDARNLVAEVSPTFFFCGEEHLFDPQCVNHVTMSKSHAKILQAIYIAAGEAGGQVSYRSLAEAVGVTTKTVGRAVKDLAERGLITTIAHVGRAAHTFFVTALGRDLCQGRPRVGAQRVDILTEGNQKEAPESGQNGSSLPPTRIVSSSSGVEVPVKNFVLSTAAAAAGEEIKIMWAEDEPTGVIGLLPGEEPSRAGVKPRGVSRRPRDRYSRPTEKWAAMDVTAEFVSRLRATHPEAGWIPIGKAGLILAGQRKKLGTTVAEELTLMEIFLRNPTNYSDAGVDPMRVFLRWIGSWRRLLGKVRLANQPRPTEAPVVTGIAHRQMAELMERLEREANEAQAAGTAAGAEVREPAEELGSRPVPHKPGVREETAPALGSPEPPVVVAGQGDDDLHLIDEDALFEDEEDLFEDDDSEDEPQALSMPQNLLDVVEAAKGRHPAFRPSAAPSRPSNKPVDTYVSRRGNVLLDLANRRPRG